MTRLAVIVNEAYLSILVVEWKTKSWDWLNWFENFSSSVSTGLEHKTKPSTVIISATQFYEKYNLLWFVLQLNLV